MIVLSYVGKLPSYIIECVYQIRLFFSGAVYLIVDDLQSPYLVSLNVIIIPYKPIPEFSELVERNIHKFIIDDKLGDRKELFIRSFERFFLLHRIMIEHDLSNVIFLEIDVLIYHDPDDWIAEFSQHELCYTFDNVNRCSGAFMYVQSADSISGLIDFMMDYISHQPIRIGLETLDEMTCLYHYYKKNPTIVELLPVYWEDRTVHSEACMNYSKYERIFDSLSIGCNMIGGMSIDEHGNQCIEKKNLRWSSVDYSKCRFQFIKDQEDRKIPHIWNESENAWTAIQNLHVHSKELSKGLSIPLTAA